jgi:hypothetical protein
MKVNVNDKKILEELNKIQQARVANLKFEQEVLCTLQENEIYINEDVMESVLNEAAMKGISNQTVFEELMMNTFGPRMSGYEAQLKQYLKGNIDFINMDLLKNNAYIEKFRFEKSLSFGNILLNNEAYKKYEFIVVDTPLSDDNYWLVPKIGVFPQKFRFPVLKERNETWMSVTPSEINTMQFAIDEVKGKLLVFGCGIGYFPYMSSIKDEVSEIIIVEKNPVIADMFSKYILPKFEYKDKVKIVINDIFRYLENNELLFDYAFCDTWFSSSDGLNMYSQLKKIERQHRNVKFLYWLEPDILENVRNIVFTNIIHGVTKQTLDTKSATIVQNKIYSYLNSNKNSINEPWQVHEYLSDKYLKDLILSI